MPRFRPSAFRFPARGERCFDVFTISSKSDFGTFRRLRMMPLNFRNSSVFMNCSDVSGGRSSTSVSLTFMRHFHFPCELLVSETATNNLAHRVDKAITICHVPVVVVVDFLVKVAEQVERLDRNVGTFQRTLEQAPEILQSVGVNTAVHVLKRMVNHGMLKLIQSVVRLKRIAVDARSGFHVLADQLLKFRLAAGIANASTDRSAALQYRRYDGLTFRAASVDLFFPFVGVHEACFAADEGFIHFDFASEFVEGLALRGRPDR